MSVIPEYYVLPQIVNESYSPSYTEKLSKNTRRHEKNKLISINADNIYLSKPYKEFYYCYNSNGPFFANYWNNSSLLICKNIDQKIVLNFASLKKNKYLNLAVQINCPDSFLDDKNVLCGRLFNIFNFSINSKWISNGLCFSLWKNVGGYCFLLVENLDKSVSLKISTYCITFYSSVSVGNHYEYYTSFDDGRGFLNDKFSQFQFLDIEILLPWFLYHKEIIEKVEQHISLKVTCFGKERVFKYSVQRSCDMFSKVCELKSSGQYIYWTLLSRGGESKFKVVD